MSHQPVSIGIIGIGHVGPHAANSLILQGIADELLLCDVNESKLAAEVQDLNDSVVFAPHRVVVRNCHADYEQLAGCDVIINAAGNVKLAAVSRDGELFATIDSARTFVGRLAAAGFEGFWVNVANPCDVVSAEVRRLSGLPTNHIIGTGTCLDSARLRTVISLTTKLAPESIQAYMIGEHGNTQIAAWSAISFAGVPMKNVISKPGFSDLKPDEVQAKAGVVRLGQRFCAFDVEQGRQGFSVASENFANGAEPEAHIPEGDNFYGGQQLVLAVIAITTERVNRRGHQQSHLVITPQHTDADSRQP